MSWSSWSPWSPPPVPVKPVKENYPDYVYSSKQQDRYARDMINYEKQLAAYMRYQNNDYKDEYPSGLDTSEGGRRSRRRRTGRRRRRTGRRRR